MRMHNMSLPWKGRARWLPCACVVGLLIFLGTEITCGQLEHGNRTVESTIRFARRGRPPSMLQRLSGVH